MTKEQVWTIILDHNPTGAKLTVKGMRKFFDTVWDASQNESLKVIRDMQDKSSNSMPDFLRDIVEGRGL